LENYQQPTKKVGYQMNKGKLVATIADVGGMSKAQAEHALNRVLTNIADAIEKGERVSLIGFGSFKVVERAEQKGRNPNTGKSIIIPAHNVVKFKPAKMLCDKLQ
jgi:DNA-binding protein HU-beta